MAAVIKLDFGMKQRGFTGQLLTGLLAALLLVAGCATGPKIDWQARVGVYPYDQAVMDYGPPDKQAKLTNGTVVADWITAHGYGYGYIEPSYSAGTTWGSYGPVTYTETRIPDYILRLTFGPDGRLIAWKNVVR